ncbi:hypothetical protein E1B28_002303 [Marasmius oreades]|uniref:DUF6534 domain-containing protein n=1 Tax=Marasmius oreades TaxID=181124 RepID=A0A9P7UMY7_9AGAR|nr:uncharacterized protein E1B28_002303 [Marasmius oreades]KAG7086341.1 hypothetical protein E1B28_002303 [Marasmius oreades]
MPFDGQIGALEIGIVTSTFLFGITTTQTYLYYQLFPHDPKWTRQLVSVVWFFELGHSISAVHALYAYTILHFGDSNVPHMKAPLSIAVNLIISEIVFVFVQGYFLHRITKVSRTWFFTFGCSFLLLVRFVITFVAFVEAVLMDSLDQYTKDWNWALITLLSIGSFVDLVIPFGLVYFLYAQRSSAYKTTAAIVDKLILWTVETGLATGFLAVLILIFYLSLKGKFAWMSVYMCLPKMFSNAFLANLNSRVKLRAMQESTDVLEMSGPDSSVRNTIHFPHRLGAKVTVSTQKVRTVESDGYSKPIEENVCPGDETPSTANDIKDVVVVV